MSSQRVSLLRPSRSGFKTEARWRGTSSFTQGRLYLRLRRDQGQSGRDWGEPGESGIRETRRLAINLCEGMQKAVERRRLGNARPVKPTWRSDHHRYRTSPSHHFGLFRLFATTNPDTIGAAKSSTAEEITRQEFSCVSERRPLDISDSVALQELKRLDAD